MEPGRVLAAVQVGKGGVNALVHTGILLCHGIGNIDFTVFVVLESGVEAGNGVVADVDHWPALALIRSGTLPTAQCRIVVVALYAAAIDVDRAVVAIAGTLVGWPAELVAEVGKVFVHLLQQLLDGQVGDVLVLGALVAPAACPPLARLVAYHAHALGQHALRWRVQLRILPAEVIVQRRRVGWPGVRDAGVVDVVCELADNAALTLVCNHVLACGRSLHGGRHGRLSVGQCPVPDGCLFLAFGQGHRGCQHQSLFPGHAAGAIDDGSLAALALDAVDVKLANAAGLTAAHIEAQAVGGDVERGL